MNKIDQRSTRGSTEAHQQRLHPSWAVAKRVLFCHGIKKGLNGSEITNVDKDVRIQKATGNLYIEGPNGYS